MNFNKKDSVATAVENILHQEGLKGGQKKIDKNHNNKIDADDFKILRGEKKVAEEIDVNDRTVDTLAGRVKTDKKDDVGPGGNFKSTKVRFHAGPENTPEEDKVTATDTTKEMQNKTKLRMGEETEQLDEKNWIAGAIKKPGAMTAAAKREGKSTSEYIKSHEHEGGKAGKRARLAKTLKSFKEEYEEHSIYDQMIQEVLSKDASAGDWIHDFVHSDNPKFAGKSKEMRKKMALAAYYAKQRNEEVETDICPDCIQDPCVCGGNHVEESVEQIDEKVLATLGQTVHGAGKDKHVVNSTVHMHPDEGLYHTHTLVHKGTVNGKKFKVNYHINRGMEFQTKHSDAEKNAVKQHLIRHKYAGKGTEIREEVEQVEEGWDDMLKAVKAKQGPQPSGGSGVKQGSRYGGSKQKDKPEQDDKKKMDESKRPESDDVPFAPPYNTTSQPVVKDKSGAEHTPMSRAKHLARLAMGRIKKDLGKK